MQHIEHSLRESDCRLGFSLARIASVARISPARSPSREPVELIERQRRDPQGFRNHRGERAETVVLRRFDISREQDRFQPLSTACCARKQR
jgi:hypothetical protein